MNPEDLEKAINILYNPHTSNPQTVKEANLYCDQFVNQNASKLKEFFIYFTQANNIHVQFWFLQSIAKIIKEQYNTIFSNIQDRKTIHQIYFEVLINKHDFIFSSKQNINKYALIFVYLLGQDFPHYWATPFQELIGYLRQASTDLNLLKNFIYFLVRIVTIFQEEYVEKAENKDSITQQQSTRLKDGIRSNSIDEILEIFTETLTNFKQFNEEFINDLLDCISMLIDWNLIDKFQNLTQIILRFLLEKNHRTSAMRNVYSLLHKGMDDPLKLNLIYSLEFMGIVQKFNIQYKERDPEGDLEDQEEEEQFQQILSESINKLGQWCIEINNPELEKQLGQEGAVKFLQLYNFLIECSVLRLDSDKPKIGRPLLEFLTPYVQSIKRLDQLSEHQSVVLTEIVKVMVRRVKYPQWFTFQKDENENEEDYVIYRDELQVLFQNLTMVKAFLIPLLSAIHQLFLTINPQTSSILEAEVPLLLLYNLQKTMPNSSTNSDYEQIIVYYQQLFQDMISINFFHYNHRIINILILENLIRYSFYLTKMGLDQEKYVQIFFGPNGVYSSDPQIVSRSIYLFYRLCEKSPEFFQPKAEEIINKCEEFIAKQEQIAASGSDTFLTLEDFLSIFGIVGTLLSFKGIDKQFRSMKLGQAVDLIKERLTSCNPNDKDKICWYIKYISCLTKGFTHEIEDIKGILSVITELLVQILYSNFNHVPMCEQILHYLQQLIKLIGVEILPIVKQVIISYFQNVSEFDRFEPILQLIFFTSKQFSKHIRDFMDEIFHYVLDKMRTRPPSQSNTSEIEKMTIKQIQSFFKLLGGVLDSDPLILFSNYNINHFPILIEFMEKHFDENIDKATKKSIAQLWKEMFLQFLDLKPKKIKIQNILFRQSSSSSGGSLSDNEQETPNKTLIVQQYPEQVNGFMTKVIQKSIQYVFSTKINFRNLEDLAIFRLFIEFQAQIRQSPYYQEFTHQLMAFNVPQDKIQSILEHCEKFNSKNLNQKGFHDWYIGFVKEIHNLNPKAQ